MMKGTNSGSSPVADPFSKTTILFYEVGMTSFLLTRCGNCENLLSQIFFFFFWKREIIASTAKLHWKLFSRNIFQAWIKFLVFHTVVGELLIQGPQSQTRPFDLGFLWLWKEIFYIFRPFSDPWLKHNLVESTSEWMDLSIICQLVNFRKSKLY